MDCFHGVSLSSIAPLPGRVREKKTHLIVKSIVSVSRPLESYLRRILLAA